MPWGINNNSPVKELIMEYGDIMIKDLIDKLPVFTGNVELIEAFRLSANNAIRNNIEILSEYMLISMNSLNKHQN